MYAQSLKAEQHQNSYCDRLVLEQGEGGSLSGKPTAGRKLLLLHRWPPIENLAMVGDLFNRGETPTIFATSLLTTTTCNP